MCVCVSVCVSSIVFKNPCQYLFSSFFWILFSILMYIMCVCLFSVLSRRVGTLQISIIIIMANCTARSVSMIRNQIDINSPIWPFVCLQKKSSGLFIAIYQVMKNRSSTGHYIFCRGEKCIASEKEEREKKRAKEKWKKKGVWVCVYSSSVPS